MQTDGSQDTLSRRGSLRTYCLRARMEVSESQWKRHAKVMEEAGGEYRRALTRGNPKGRLYGIPRMRWRAVISPGQQSLRPTGANPDTFREVIVPV